MTDSFPVRKRSLPDRQRPTLDGLAWLSDTDERGFSLKQTRFSQTTFSFVPDKRPRTFLTLKRSSPVGRDYTHIQRVLSGLQVEKTLMSAESRHGYDSFFRFDSTQSQKVLIPTQLMTHNGFQELIQINSRLEMVFWKSIQMTHDSNGFPEFRFQSTHDSKTFPGFWFKSTHKSKGFPEFWFKSTHD